MFGAAIVFHWLKYLLHRLESKLSQLPGSTALKAPTMKGYHQAPGEDFIESHESHTHDHHSSEQSTVGHWIAKVVSLRVLEFPVYSLRLHHSILASAVYIESLLLMLVVMSFNSGLFVAVAFGYFVGNYLFVGATTSSQDCS